MAQENILEKRLSELRISMTNGEALKVVQHLQACIEFKIEEQLQGDPLLYHTWELLREREALKILISSFKDYLNHDK